jgi:hypothetical protein
MEFFTPTITEGAGVIGAAAGQRQEVTAPFGWRTDNVWSIKFHGRYTFILAQLEVFLLSEISPSS